MRDEIGTVALSERVGVYRRSVESVLRASSVLPHAPTRARYVVTAADWCSHMLIEAGRLAGPSAFGVVWCYQRLTTGPMRTCQVCGRPVDHPLRQLQSDL